MAFTIRVPATSANIGPGFDCLGIAWNIYARFTFHFRDKADGQPLRCYQSAEEAGYSLGSNLVLDAYWAYGKATKVALPDIGVYIASAIPSTRGLGSSAACIVAGAEAARAVARTISPKSKAGGFSDSSILQVATQVEGHPDNVAPALYGGLQIAKTERGTVRACACPVSERLAFYVLIPDFSSSTKKARTLLPEKVPRADAVANLASLGFLFSGLRTGDRHKLRVGLTDRLHEPYRRPQIPGFLEIEKKAREAGAIGTVISGAGSTLLCVAETEKTEALDSAFAQGLPQGWEARRVYMDKDGASIEDGNIL